ncbi:hypothetical protein V8C44DRAFT_325866 [Trichoderma aethiopicum]
MVTLCAHDGGPTCTYILYSHFCELKVGTKNQVAERAQIHHHRFLHLAIVRPSSHSCFRAPCSIFATPSFCVFSRLPCRRCTGVCLPCLGFAQMNWRHHLRH